jgi:hypothetical protein
MPLFLAPIGAVDVDDVRSHADHDICSNGRIYEVAGDLDVVFTNNQTVTSLEDFGVMDGSTVQVTCSRIYDNGNPVHVQAHDRFFIKNFSGSRVTSERFEHNQANLDRLQFPALTVDLVIDSHGERYYQDIDFVVDKGCIRWTTQHRPGYDPEQERGDVAPFGIPIARSSMYELSLRTYV